MPKEGRIWLFPLVSVESRNSVERVNECLIAEISNSTFNLTQHSLITLGVYQLNSLLLRLAVVFAQAALRCHLLNNRAYHLRMERNSCVTLLLVDVHACFDIRYVVLDVV